MILELVNKFKRTLILATVFSALSSVISILLIRYINAAANANEAAELQAMAMPFLLGVFAMLFIGFTSQLLLARLGAALVFKVRNFMVERVLNVSYRNLEKIGGHRVLATITTDVTSIGESLSIIPVFAVNLATIVFCLVYLGFLSLPLFLVLLGALIIGAGVSSLMMRKGERSFSELREREDAMFDSFKTLVDGAKELNINQNRRDFFHQRQATPNLEQVRKAENKANLYWILNQNWAGSVLFLGLGALVYVGMVELQVRREVMTSFVMFLIYLMGPITFVMRSFSSVYKGKVAYHKIHSLELMQQTQTEQRQSQTPPLANWQSISVKDLCFSYEQQDDKPFAIGPIDFNVEQSQVVFIRGSNGSGKSTFAKVLVGLYPASKGQLRLNGVLVNKENIQWYRNHFSTIFSDFYLFDHIIDSKGALVTSEQVQEHLNKLQLANKISVVDGKLSTKLLSQGQRKRLAMVLAYAEDAAIYLFDEWAADQDPYFRDYFYTELLPELKSKGKSVVVISHDDRYFHLADRLYNFDDGIAYLEKGDNKVSVRLEQSQQTEVVCEV